MKSNITFIIAAVLLANLVAPASARFEGDEGGASAYPRFRSERSLSNARSADILVNRPFYQR
jgi:hypothetical protein